MGKPSSQPTREPISRPTNVPTNRPSAKPSARPTPKPQTPRPTRAKETNFPTGQPSSAPSINFNYTSSPQFVSFLDAKQRFSNSFAQLPVYSFFSYKGTTAGAGTGFDECAAWKRFGSQLTLPFAGLYLSSLTLSYTKSLPLLQQVNATITCGERQAVAAIAAALGGGAGLSVSCDGHAWVIYSCPRPNPSSGASSGSSSRSICIDCRPSTVQQCRSPACFSVGLTGISPCSACSGDIKSAGFALLGAKVSQVIYYPQFTEPPVLLEAGNTSVTIGVNVTLAGRVYCAALPLSASGGATANLLSASQVKALPGAAALYLPQSNTNHTMHPMVLTGLYPDTAYVAWCYTEDFSTAAMPLGEVLATRLPFETACCKSVQLASTCLSTIAADTPTLFSFSLSAPPTATVVVSLSVSPLPSSADQAACKWSVSGATPKAIPAFFTLTSRSTVLSGSFLIRGGAGCFTLTAAAASSSANETWSSVALPLGIRSADVAPDPPKLASAAFSADGRTVLAVFDSPTDQGAATNPYYQELFDCLKLLASLPGSPGGSGATCMWTSAVHLTVQLPVGSSLAIGAPLILGDKKVKPVCPSFSCPLAPASQVIIAAPVSPITPAVLLSGPSSIGSCSNLVLDATGSTGAAGRAWASVLWDVAYNPASQGELYNATAVRGLRDFLNGPASLTQVTIDKSFLSIGSWTFTLVLQNWLGQSATQSLTVAVSNTASKPVVSIAGPPLLILLRSSALALTAVVSLPSCAGRASLSYKWRVYQGLVYMPDLVSASRDQRAFSLPPLSLDASSTYSVFVEVGVVDTSVSATSSVTVQVGEAGVVAAIAGGAQSTASSASDILVDASAPQNSYDIDYPSDSSRLSFSWSCRDGTLNSTNFGGACPDALANLTDSLTSGALRIPRLTVVAVVPQTFMLTVVVRNLYGAMAATSTALTVVSKVLPSVSIAPPTSAKYLVTDRIALSASLTGPLGAMSAVWSSAQLSPDALAAISVTANGAARVFTAGSGVPFTLTLKENSLSPGVTYVFVCSATYSAVAGVASSQTITVVTNAPPAGGQLSITPATGYAMNTTYSFATLAWTDDAADLPLQFVFTAWRDSSTTWPIKPRNINSYASAQLGQGQAATNFLVTGVAIAYDTFFASSTAQTTTVVNPVQSVAALAGALAASLTSAFATGDSNQASQAIAAISSSLSVVDCSLLPAPCSSLLRSECVATANTCGPCLAGSLGVSGESNVACASPLSLSRVGGACSADASCITGLCVAGTCVEAMKTCLNGCSRRGQCVFYDANGRVAETCGVNDALCQATCTCSTGSFGADCSLTYAIMATALTMRETMCVGLLSAFMQQDITADSIASLASTVSSLLVDATQVTDAALGNCTAALVGAILENPSLAGKTNAPLCATALSAVLQQGSALPLALVASVNTALSALAAAVQANMAVGEAPQTISTKNARISTSIPDPATLALTIFTPPESAAEAFSDTPKTTIGLVPGNDSAADPLGVSLLQYNSMPAGSQGLASISVGLQLTYVGSSATGSRRRLEGGRFLLSPPPPPPAITVTLQNTRPIAYISTPAANSSVVCPAAARNFTLTVTCAGSEEHLVACPGQAGTAHYSCPPQQQVPVCASWDAALSIYAPDPLCRLLRYSPTNTTCACQLSMSSPASGSGGSSGSAQYSSLTETRSGAFQVTAFIPQTAPLLPPAVVGDATGSSSSQVLILSLTVAGGAALLLLLSLCLCVYRRRLTRDARLVAVALSGPDSGLLDDDLAAKAELALTIKVRQAHIKF